MSFDEYQPAQGGPEPEPEPIALQPAPVTERLPAYRLREMWVAWESAKELENLEQNTAARYYHGKQWTNAELRELKRRKQPPTVKNRIKRKVDFLVGVEQSQRRDPKAVPRNQGGEKAAYVGTACLRYVSDVNKSQAIASEVASDGLVRGIGAKWSGVAQINGRLEIKQNHVPCDRWFYDPRSERWDFSDALYLGEHQWMDIDQAKEMFPFAADKIESLSSQSALTMGGGVLPQLSQKDRNWIDPNKRRIYIVQMWYRHNGVWLWDVMAGQETLVPEDIDCLSPYQDENGQPVHPYEAWSPYVDETGGRYGVVRDMIPIQDEINKRSSKALHALTVRQTKGEKGAVADVEEMKRELAKPDGHVEYNKNFEFDVLEQTSQVQGNLELLQEAKAEIENLGPNPGLIGRGVENQSGRAILAQQNSGMTELSPVFERFREWKLRCYRRDWNLIRQFWTTERIIRVSGDPEAPQHLTINLPVMDPMTGQVQLQNAIAEIDVDIILDEGPDTVTMREELMQQLSQLGPGVVPPELLIEMSNIGEKEQILKKLQEYKQPPPELQALQKRMGELEEMLKAADVDKKQADTEKVRADTIKTLAETGVMDVGNAMQTFPLHYRQPTTLDQAKGMMGGAPPPGMPPNALAGPQGPMPPPGALPPPNGLGGPPDGLPPGPPPDGLQGLPVPPTGEDFLAQSSTPWVQ